MKNGFLLFHGFLKRYPVRLFITALCAFYCFMSYFGLLVARASLEMAEEDFLNQCGRVDILLSCEAMPPEALKEALREIDGIEAFSGVYRLDCKGICADGITRTIRLYGMSESSLLRPILNSETHTDGSFFVSYGYLSDFGGAHLAHITLENGMDLQLEGTYYLPSHTSVYIDRFTVSTNGDIVDVFTDMETIWQISGEERVNLAYINVKADAEIDTVLQDISENRAFSVEYAIPFAEDPAFSASSQLLSLVLRICGLFPFILFGTGLIFICVFLSGMASRSRMTVAVLLSDGEGFLSIFSGFFLSALLWVLFGMIASLPVSVLLAEEIAKTTTGNMGIPYAGICFPSSLLFGGIGLCLAVSLTACVICMVTVKRKTIWDLKRRRKKKKVSALLDILVFCLCSCAALTLVLTTCMYRDSVSEVREELFFERYDYDAEIIYSDFVPLTELEKLISFGDVKAEPILLGSAELSFAGNTCRVFGMGISETETMINFRDGDGNWVYPVRNQVILAEQTAQRLRISPGDILQAQVTYGSRRIDILCRVLGLSKQYSSFTQIISVDTVTEYLDSSGVMNGALVTLSSADGENLLSFLAYAKTLDSVYAVQLRSSAITRFDRRFEGVRNLTRLTILDGIMLGFSIFVLMGYGTWKKNLRKNSILFMLGKSPFRIALGDLTKGFVGALFGFLLGIPLSIFTEKRILAILSTESTVYPLILRRETLLFGIFLICFYAAVTTAGYVVSTRYRAKDIL